MRSKIVLVLLLVVLGSVLPASAQEGALVLNLLGTYATGLFDEGGSEIVAYDPATQSLFVTNGDAGAVDVISIADPSAPELTNQLDITPYGGGLTHVSVRDGIVAVAVEADPNTDPGSVVFFSTEGEFLAQVMVGALPDQLTFTPDGTRVLTANEGQPSDDYSADPEGSVSIIDISGGVENLTQDNVVTVGFTDFNEDGARAAEFDPEIRIYGPNATVAQDLEPEYVAVSPDSATAFVTLQENNALAIIDIASATVTSIRSFGFKDYSVEGSGIDASNEDDAINITTYPAFGMYQPDGMATFERDGAVYLITANEGDSRDYEDVFSEEGELSEATLDAEAFPDAAQLQQEGTLGKLEYSTASGDTDGDGDVDVIYSFGARSFAIWDAEGNLVYDSGDQLEQLTAELLPDEFNSTNDENGSFDDRSDNSGPEPEAVVLGEIEGRLYAFVGLERIGGVMVFDITDPTAPAFVTYSNNRDFSGDATAGTAGDLAPEGLLFISAENSPTGNPLLAVANEVSGTTSVFEITLA